MKYNQPWGISDPAAPYINGDPSTGTMGSIPPAWAVEHPQREIVNFITDAAISSGLTPDDNDLHQLAKSVQSGGVNFGIDTGAANILAIALTPPLTKYIDGMMVWVRVAITNTGPAVLSINGLSGVNIVRRGGGVLQAGDLQGNYNALLVFNAPHNNFEMYGAAYSAVTGIPILAANSNLYVNQATGSDTLYDGSAPTISGPHGPFKTINKAIATTFTYGPSVYTMTINIANATYPEACGTPRVIGPTMIFQGQSTAGTIITGAPNRHTIQASNANIIQVYNCTVTATGGGSGPPCCFEADTGGTIFTNNCASGSANGYVFDSYGGYVYPGNHTFNSGSNSNAAFCAFFGGFILFQANVSINHAGPCSFSGGYAVVSAGGMIGCGPPYLPTFGSPGYVSGYKYNCALNGVISTQGQSTSFFPGSAAGLIQSGGQYG